MYARRDHGRSDPWMEHAHARCSASASTQHRMIFDAPFDDARSRLTPITAATPTHSPQHSVRSLPCATRWARPRISLRHANAQTLPTQTTSTGSTCTTASRQCDNIVAQHSKMFSSRRCDNEWRHSTLRRSVRDMNVEELVIREAIRDTIARYNHAGDRAKFDAMVRCFTPDGTLHIVDGEVHRGHDQLLKFFSGVSGSTQAPELLTLLRHCVTNTLIEVESATVATANSYFQVVTNQGLDHWGTYRDRFTHDPATNRWLIEHRSVKTDAYADTSLFR